MKLEILLATTNQENDSLIEELGVHSDIIVCNQNQYKTSYSSYKKADFTVRWYDFQEKGVGLNRNNALLRSTADLCLVADDDVVYCSDYDKVVLNAFEEFPEADVILFNIFSSDGKKRDTGNRYRHIGLYNCGKYGAVRIAFRRMSVIKNNITFNQLFGGGSMFSAGEDTTFIMECIRKGLKVIAVPDAILTLTDNRDSTWFKGYNQKFFEDLGTSYCNHYRKLAKIFVFIQLYRYRKKWLKNYSFKEAMYFANKGIVKYKRLR